MGSIVNGRTQLSIYSYRDGSVLHDCDLFIFYLLTKTLDENPQGDSHLSPRQSPPLALVA